MCSYDCDGFLHPDLSTEGSSTDFALHCVSAAVCFSSWRWYLWDLRLGPEPGMMSNSTWVFVQGWGLSHESGHWTWQHFTKDLQLDNHKPSLGLEPFCLGILPKMNSHAQWCLWLNPNMLMLSQHLQVVCVRQLELLAWVLMKHTRIYSKEQTI